MKLALIGKRLTHSYSAVIHDIFFRLTGISGTYDLVEVPEPEMLGAQVAQFEKEGYDGFNITIPYKEDIIGLCGWSGEEVKKLGAANTVLLGKTRKAYNTDYFGFMNTLKINEVNPDGEKWLVLGYGGGARSVCAVLLDMGAEVTVASTSMTGEGFIGYDAVAGLKGYAGVVNTTPLGMYPAIDGCPLERNDFRNFKTAVDIVYNPLETRFLSYARENGLKCVQGLYMLVAQAVKAQEIWNGREFGTDVINTIFTEMEDRL